MHFNKIVKKICSLSLALVLGLSLVGCDSVEYKIPVTEETTTAQTNTPSETKPAQDSQYSAQDLQIQQEVDEYLDELFVEMLGDDPFSIHFTLKDYESYGIEVSHSLGEIGIAAILDAEEENEEHLNEVMELLQNYEASLTDRQLLSLKCLYAYFEKNAEYNGLYLLQNEFGPNSGFLSNISVNFIEFMFENEDDVVLYLDLIQDMDRYASDLMDYVEYQADNGYFMSDDCADKNIEMVDKYFSTEINPLIASFDEKIDALDSISDDKKQEYKELNLQYVEQHYDKAYTIMKDSLTELKGSCTNELGLVYFDDGADLYEAILKDKTATSMTPQEIIDFLDNSMDELMEDFYAIYYSNAGIEDEYQAFELAMTDPEQILKFLSKKVTMDFPAPYTTQFVVQYQSKATEVEGTLAYYLQARIDDINYNSIKVNGSAFENQDSVSLYTTLAHEGFPGHLYQFTSVLGNPEIPDACKIVDFIGLTEGYAEYASDRALTFTGISDALAEYIALNDLYGYIIESRVDLGVNYEGWTKEKCEEYLWSNYSISTDTADAIFSAVQADPGLLLPYTVGHILFRQYRKEAEQVLGNAFDPIAYNQVIVDTGFVDFDIMKEELDKYIYSK